MVISREDNKLAQEVEAHLRNSTNPIPLFAKTGILSTIFGISLRIACLELSILARSEGRFVLKATYDASSEITVFDVAESMKTKGIGVKEKDILIWTYHKRGRTPSIAGSGGEIDDLTNVRLQEMNIWLDRSQLVRLHPNFSETNSKRDQFHRWMTNCALVSGVAHLAVPSLFPAPRSAMVVTGLNGLEIVRNVAFGAFVSFTALRALSVVQIT